MFEYMQLKEIDKEAAQALEMRATAATAAAAELAHKALLPARMRLESYRKAFSSRLDKAEEAYRREVSCMPSGGAHGAHVSQASGAR